MSRRTGKGYDWGRNGNRFSTLLIVLLLSGLFGCGKTEAYTVSLEQTDMTAEMIPEEENAPEAEPAADADAGQETQDGEICIHVCGAVRNPGVYVFYDDVRVYEAIAAAGGLLDEACGEALNQAETVTDETRIYVPTKDEWEKTQLLSVTEDAESSDGLININSADAAQLCELPGVGETKAQAIITYRSENGTFKSIEEIQNVPGIKSGLFSQIKDLIKVQ